MGTIAARKQPVSQASSDSLYAKVEGEKSQEVVFGIVGHAGSGSGWVAQVLAEELKNQRYSPLIVKASELIEAAAANLDLKVEGHSSAAIRAVRRLQDLGDALREKMGHCIIAGLAIREMRRLRRVGDVVPAFIIDQLKHPEEIEFLRDVYGSSFYLIGILCPYAVRFERLRKKYKGATAQEIEDLCANDEKGPSAAGQHVRKTLHRADFFVGNDAETEEPLARELTRLMDIVGKKLVPPNRNERGMYAAWGAALSSSCLSRQVGAAILDDDGNIIATGTNDVPKYGGGLYPHESEPLSHEDARCFRRGELPQCNSDKKKREIYKEIHDRLKKSSLLSSGVTPERITQELESTRVGGLIEFSRAVHAEMDAIISVARRGSGRVAGTTLYCTTYPCHDCARHMIAAGIKEVVYIEPYPKSQATDLHEDAITETNEAHKVRFCLFSGVAPRRFAALFEMREDRKNDEGFLLDAPSDTARHRDPISKKSYLELETEIAELVDKLLPTRASI